jgi:hypothetical protein
MFFTPSVLGRTVQRLAQSTRSGDTQRLRSTESMSRILIPTKGPGCWKQFLADPKHWKAGYSAMSLAQCWEAANGFPPEIQKLFAAYPRFHNIELLLGIPEHKVALPGGRRASQNDIFLLAKAKGELVAITIEGKVNECFDKTVGEWIQQASSGKHERLAALRQELGLAEIPTAIRYQLLHRTASAIIEAKRFNAASAVMIVHSFNQEHLWFDDYAAFVALFGATAKRGELVPLKDAAGVAVYSAWVTGDSKFLKDLSNETTIRSAVVP